MSEILTAKELKEYLMYETCVQCGHEERKYELHMSQLWKPVNQIVDELLNGVQVTTIDRLKFYQGNEAERNMRDRLQGICEVKNLPMGGKKKIYGFEGRLQGEIDGDIDNKILLEVKTVPNDDALAAATRDNTVPFRVFAQVNGYMYWGKYDRTIVIYESRGTGKLWCVDVEPDLKLQEELADKALMVLADKRVIETMKKFESARRT